MRPWTLSERRGVAVAQDMERRGGLDLGPLACVTERPLLMRRAPRALGREADEKAILPLSKAIWTLAKQVRHGQHTRT